MGALALGTPLSRVNGIGPRFLGHLERLGLTTVRDLLWHFPTRYEDFSETKRIADLEPGERVTVQGVIRSVDLRRTWRRHMTVVEATIEDASGTVRAVWFNQPFLKQTLRPGRLVSVAGKVAESERDLYLSHPTYELISRAQMDAESDAEAPVHTGRLVPVYPETHGLTSKGIRFLVQPLLAAVGRLEEWLPNEVRRATNLPELNEALSAVHFPEKVEDALAAKRRFAFEDLFLLQLLNAEEKLKLAREKAPPIRTTVEHIKEILAELPFLLTVSQKKSLWEIVQDMARGAPMNRLLQGDVGSGKTVVAAVAALIASENGYQTAIMAPTEVLARQHFGTFERLLGRMQGPHHPTIGLLTASEAKIVYERDLEVAVTKREFQKRAASGDVAIAIGTHALIQKSVTLPRLGLVVVDEQHRFGVHQRAALLIRRQTQTTTPTDADNGFLFKELTYKLRGCCIKVKDTLGPGHKESVYQNALAEELRIAGIRFETEKSIPIEYNNKKIGTYRPDFVVEDSVIVELKALPSIGSVEKRQLWTYLKGSLYRLALLVNFSPQGVQIERVVYDTARQSQRSSASGLVSSAFLPHFLSMSATPIPRTLMLTVFGDLDLSLISELPSGRKKIITKIVDPANRPKAYAFIRGEVTKGRQAFVICPRIEPPAEDDTALRYTPRQAALWEVKSVKEEFEKLSKQIFPDLTVAMLHGQMKSKEKEKIMNSFEDGVTDILVSTSVVEVGVDVPNATVMVIEGSDRFGLAQLYQFRGRVGRGPHQSFCLLFTDSASRTARERLTAIVEAKNGFELAERDLKLRGPGEFFGEKQTGLPDVAMRGLQDPQLVAASRAVALSLIERDPRLAAHAALTAKLAEFRKRLHRE